MPEPINDNAFGKESFQNPNEPELSLQQNSIEGLFLRALQLESSLERETFLERQCHDNLEKKNRVRVLLKAFEEAGSFLETPALPHRSVAETTLSFLRPSQREGCLGTIGHYDVVEEIGRGGMGIVLKAMDPKLNRIVAVKVLFPELGVNPNARRRFLREAQAAAAINHPHVVTIYSVDDTQLDVEGRNVPPFIAMEFVAGQSLQQKLDRSGALRLEEILRISRQIADGLSEAHKQGLIHRDIKPSNILLENGVERVKITDFGLARAIDDVTVTRIGEVAGTPSYMSPEQACGERVDNRSDLFSLGSVIYAMCTGHSPFRGDSIAHVIKRVTQESPRPIELQNPELPSWLIQIVNSLLQKQPENRIQNASELVVILDRHLKELQQPIDADMHLSINQQLLTVPSSQNPERSNEKKKLKTRSEFWVLRILQASIAFALLGLLTGVMAVFSIVRGNNMVPGEPLSQSVFPFIPMGFITASVLLGWIGMIAAMLLMTKSKTESGIPFLYILLGPLGIVLWLMDRERRDRE